MTDEIGARDVPSPGSSPSGQAPSGLAGCAATIPRAKRTVQELKAQPKPWTVTELERLSEWYFGAPLHLEKLQVWGEGATYQVAERYTDYHGKGWLHTTYCIKGYDYSRAFWQHIVGNLYCGGIAAKSYGQTSHEPTDTERLRALEADMHAQAIETRRAETLGSVEDESAVPQGCAKDTAHDQ